MHRLYPSPNTIKHRIILLLCCALPLLSAAAPRKSSGPRPYVWVLDAGHGGKDVGTKAAGHYEKDINLRVVKELQTLLKKHKPGIKVVLTRSSDHALSLPQRCRIANNAKADLFVSIHCNFMPNNPHMQGTETFFGNPYAVKNTVTRGTLRRNQEKSELVAWLMQRQYKLAGRVSQRGAKRCNYYVCLHTSMPSVLTELGFMSNTTERNFLLSDDGVRQLAICLYNALDEYHVTLQKKTTGKALAKLRATDGRTSGVSGHALAFNAVRPAQEKKVAEAKTASAVKENPSKPTAQEPLPATAKAVTTKGTTPSAPTKNFTTGGTTTQLVDDALNGMTEEEMALAHVETETDDMAEEPVLEGRISAPDEPTSMSGSAAKSASQSVGAATMPVFSIQLVAVSSELSPHDKRLKGYYPVTFVKSGTMYKGLYGGTTDYEQARRTLQEVRREFPDAFIVAYLGTEPISTADALKMRK